MTRLAHGVLGLLAALLAFVAPPLWGADELAMFGGWAFFILNPPLIVLLVAIVGAFRAVSVASLRSELAAQRALGLTRGAAVRGAARDGLLAGLIWGGCGILVGAVACQLSAGFSDTEFSPYSLLVLACMLAVIVISATVAWTVVAVWATRDTAGATARSGGDAPTARAGLRRGERVLVIGAVALVAFAVIAVQAGLGEQDGDPSVGTVVLILIVYAGLVVALPGLLVWGAARLGVRLSRSFAGLVRRGDAPGPTRTIAADGLARPTPLRGIAIAGIGTVLALATAVSLSVNALSARNDEALVLTPDAVISTVPVKIDYDAEVTALTAGWAPEAVPPSVIAELQADDRLVVVPGAVLVTDPKLAPRPDREGEHLSRDVFITVHDADMRLVTANGMRPLYFAPAVALTGNYGWSSGALDSIAVHGTVASVATPSVSGPFVTVERGWAEEQFTTGVTSALLVYVADAYRDGAEPSADDLRVNRILDEHDLGGLLRTTAGQFWDSGTSPADPRTLVLVTAPFLLLAVGLVVALAAAGVRLRARDYATLQALGATGATVRRAAAIEAGVTTTIGAAMGLAAGTLMGLVLTPMSANAPAETWLWNAGFDLAHTPWGPLFALAVAAVVLASVSALLLRARLSSAPAEQLRVAAGSGVA